MESSQQEFDDSEHPVEDVMDRQCILQLLEQELSPRKCPTLTQSEGIHRIQKEQKQTNGRTKDKGMRFIENEEEEEEERVGKKFLSWSIL